MVLTLQTCLKQGRLYWDLLGKSGSARTDPERSRAGGMLSFCTNPWEDRLSAGTPISSRDVACGHFKALVRRVRLKAEAGVPPRGRWSPWDPPKRQGHLSRRTQNEWAWLVTPSRTLGIGQQVQTEGTASDRSRLQPHGCCPDPAVPPHPRHGGRGSQPALLGG